MTTEQKLPKKQHYIPQFYLKGFSHDKNNLWMFDKKLVTQKSIMQLTTKSIAFENNFYTYKSIDKTKETLESMFSQMEGVASNVIEKISGGGEINEQEKSDLAVFLSFLWLRVPKSKKRVNDMTRDLSEQISRKMIMMTPNERIREILSKEGKTISDKEIQEMREFGADEKRSKFVLDIPQNYWIKNMLQMGMDLTPTLQICDWELCIADKQFAFITSDNPFMLIPSRPIVPFNGLGLLTPGAKKVVPLTSKVCLVMHEPNKNPVIKYSMVNKEYFKKINRFTFNNAHRFVFSSDEGKLNKIIKDNR